MQINIWFILCFIFFFFVVVIYLYRYSQNRPYQCEKCFRLVPTRNICVLSSSLEDDSNNQSLCQKCIQSHIENGFKFFKYKAVMVHPDPKHNAYQFYAFSKSALYGLTAEYIAKLQLALPSDNQSCESCSNRANFSWYGRDFFKNNNYLSDFELNAPKKMLCGVCLASAFIALLEKEKIVLRQYVSPYEDNGLGTPWDY